MKLRKTLVATIVAALTMMFASPALASEGDPQPGNDGVHKVWVCKYSGTPYVDEVLKPGKNPIAVDGNATTGTYFNDGQGQSYVLDQVTDENTAQGERYTGEKVCPEGRSFDWDWEYAAPTCDALTVTYPAALPAGQANDVNIHVKNLATGEQKTLNFHNNDGTWSGTQSFTYASHSSWEGWAYFAVTWTQVAGTNYHWSGNLVCGEPVKPPKPDTKVESTQWEVSDYKCDSESVSLMREVTTTTYTWDAESWSWKSSKSTETETSSRPMTAQEKAANCEEPPVDVCTNLPDLQTEVPAGYETDGHGNCTVPPVDVCKNLDGIQTEVPAGYKADGQGNCCKCTPPPVVDKCLNIDGKQATVPEGLVKDGDNCIMPPVVEVSDWYGEPQCGVDFYFESATETTTTYTLVQDQHGWEFVPAVTYKELLRKVYVEAVPCEDASASVTVTPATCDAPGSVAVAETANATLSGELSQEPGDHEATFVADEGHAFPGGDTTLVVDYTVEDQLTDGCAPDTQEPNIDGTIVGAVCNADAPFLEYDITLDDPDNVSTDDGTATITFVHPKNPAKNWSTTVDIGSGRILWPGASLDANGAANNWPGWKYVPSKDAWVSVGNANYGWTRAENTEVLIEVNPSKTLTVSYPPATPVCNSEPPETVVSVLDAPPAAPVTGVASYTG
ncbi:hypothetical protein [Demequina silvatica]|uniref:hypothetical protein n=1 Tax=Demequina silvatica TaxID=1638988 RepID=UPI000A442190|nr:hypothetical protein [Demequina silvatica]